MARPTTFRADLEGLRGAAILLVVGFHAGVRALQGGFVGVDVFFVLSGFFITGLLLRDQADDGDIDLTGFYGKRALRLLPALLVVLLATLGIVMWLYAPIDRPGVAATARSVALYSGNVEFARNALNYFSSDDNPLLHTWSLAVEEQFYLVWPLLFVGLSAWGRRSLRDVDELPSDGERRRLYLAFAVIGGVSLIASVWLTHTAQSWAFFGMPTRIWEFVLGGIVALRLSNADVAPGARATLLQLAGLIAIALAIGTLDRSTAYPGVAAVLPALGAVGLIIGGQLAPDGVISRALGAAWLRWFGRLSYAWYLWHWPLVGLGEVIDPEIGVAGRLAWSGVALALAWLTLRYIESPARDGGRLARIPRRYLTPAAVGASVGAALLAHVSLGVARTQASLPDQRRFAAARSDRMLHDCWATTVEDVKGPCEFGDRSASTTLVLLGDSHAEHWLGGLDRAGKANGWKIVAMVKGGCPVADMSEGSNVRLRRNYRECARYREAMVRRIVAMRPTAVILSSWDHYVSWHGSSDQWQVSSQVWQRGLRRTYARLAGAGVPVLVMRGTPRTWFNVPRCLSRRAARLPFASACDYERARGLPPKAVATQDAAASGLPVTFINMNDQICATPRCSAVKNGVIVFTDDNHLTASFSRSVAPVLGQRIASALKNR